MKRFLLASAACFVLALPAVAAQNSPQRANGAAPTQQQNQSKNTRMNQAQSSNGSQTNANNNQRQAQAEIRPSSLNKQEIEQVQTNLNKAGFNAKRVDGIWGRETSDALRNFQQAKHLPGNGELNQQTLAALDVNIPNEGRAASESNKGGAAQSGSAGQTQPVQSGAPSTSSGEGANQPK